MLLVGDWAQLLPVPAGGAFKLLPTRDPTLRPGQPSVAATNVDEGRAASGSREDMIDLIFDGWRNEVTAGRISLMMAVDAETVNDLNGGARAYQA